MLRATNEAPLNKNYYYYRYGKLGLERKSLTSHTTTVNGESRNFNQVKPKSNISNNNEHK